MFLSILIPSKRPEGLQRFMDSFYRNTVFTEDIEIVILVDDDIGPERTTFLQGPSSVTTIHRHSVKPVHMGHLDHECYKYSTGDWIMFGNDDITIETNGWDVILRDKIGDYPDELALFWPDDGKFKVNLSCFPILSRKVLEGIHFFPSPYRRYKIDDTIYNVFPFNRRVYMPEIKMPHTNEMYTKLAGNEPVEDDGAALHDNSLWVILAQERENMKKFFEPVRKNVKVMIGASTGEFPRRADFYDYMNILEKPADSIVMYSHERSPARARNEIIQQAIDYDCTHVCLIDDDQVFRTNALMLLLEHDVDIVSGLYFARIWPHKPLIFDQVKEDGACRWYHMNGTKSRLVPIVAAGFGFILLKLDIFKKLEKPWVRLGELDPQEWCDDIGFFKRVREAGIESFCDTECRIGHIGTMIIWPDRQMDGTWVVGYDTGSGTIAVQLPELSDE